MTLKQFLKNSYFTIFNRNINASQPNSFKKLIIIIYSLICLTIFIIYSITFSSINNQKSQNEQNLINFFETDEFVNIKRTFFDNLKSPYLEFNYIIEINDSIGKILRKFKIEEEEIKKITNGLKEKKLTNIYAGRELNIIIKKKRRQKK